MSVQITRLRGLITKIELFHRKAYVTRSRTLTAKRSSVLFESQRGAIEGSLGVRLFIPRVYGLDRLSRWRYHMES